VDSDKTRTITISNFSGKKKIKVMIEDDICVSRNQVWNRTLIPKTSENQGKILATFHLPFHPKGFNDHVHATVYKVFFNAKESDSTYIQYDESAN
jgi:hypothetical protein